MTEAEWNACDDPGFMLDAIVSKAGDRKLRLFAVACCRRMWHLLGDQRSRSMVEVTERYADGLEPLDVLRSAMENARGVAEQEEDTGEPTPATAAWLIAREPPSDATQTCGIISVLLDREAMKNQTDWWTGHETEGEEEAGHQSRLLRSIFGPRPFRPISCDSAWLTSTVKHLAESIYQERAFDRLPILSDALEDAGCGNADILNHCRQPGDHVRGCWVVDLLLGKT